MPLPANGQEWPPKHMAHIFGAMAEWDAWYANHTDTLTSIYSSGAGRSRSSGGVMGAVRRFFWGKQATTGETTRKIHVPVASDICQASADLLFSEPATITANNEGAQERLNLIADDSFQHVLTGAAETAAALGGVYLRAAWDDTVKNNVFVTKVDADKAIPEFAWGILQAVTFWTIVGRNGQIVWRHLERHETDANGIGIILHGLYQGTTDKLGQIMALTDHRATETLVVNEHGAVSTQTPGLAVEYIPNQIPNRAWRNDPTGTHLGRSDLDGVCEHMDALDETMSSWMRDVHHGKARLIVPNSMLQSMGAGNGAGFDMDQELFSGVNAAPGSVADAKMSIEQVQFDIRTEAHKATFDQILATVYRTAGYSAGTFGENSEARIMTATEVIARERRSFLTRDRKVRSFKPALQRFLEKCLLMDAALFAGPGVPADTEIDVAFGDSIQDPESIRAQNAQLLFTGQSGSTITRVRTLHPDWDEEKIGEEARMIREENGLPDLSDPDRVGVDGQGLSYDQ